MSKLTEFLSKNDAKDMKKEVELTGRLAGMPFTIKAMTSNEYDNYTKVSQRIVGKEIKIDQNRLRTLIIKNHVIDPDFTDVKLLGDKQTPEQFINDKLLIGEQLKLQEAILALSGFDTDINEEIEEAKN